MLKSLDRAATFNSMGTGIEVPAVVAIAVDPTDSSIVYAGTSNGGVLQTTTDGQ